MSELIKGCGDIVNITGGIKTWKIHEKRLRINNECTSSLQNNQEKKTLEPVK